MPTSHPRDLTDAQWVVLDPLIPNHLDAKTVVVAHGKTAVPFSTESSGCCVPVPRGLNCPIAIRHTKLVTDGFNNGFGQAF
jgi:hypothetical protein